MESNSSKQLDTIAFAEKVLSLLEFAKRSSTYKYAVLLGLIDLCFEKSTKSGLAPTSITTRELAEKIIEFYWLQTYSYNLRWQEKGVSSNGRILKQNHGNQAKIISCIIDFRHQIGSLSLTEVQRSFNDDYQKLVDEIEWKLIEMPLPRLQQIGNKYDEFIYLFYRDDSINKNHVKRKDFDNRILFLGNASQHLVRLAGLLRPIIQREWASMVAKINKDIIEDSKLEEFLFGPKRRPLPSREKIALRELQNNRCFYCDQSMPKAVEVDHFMPWARYPDNGIENLVIADKTCNHSKRDFLAAATHVQRWIERFDLSSTLSTQLGQIAENATWDRHPDRTINVARAVYLHLPNDIKLWDSKNKFVDVNKSLLRSTLIWY